jgi:hypothetical protein
MVPGFGNLQTVPCQQGWEKLRPKAELAPFGPSHDAYHVWTVGKLEGVGSRLHEISTEQSIVELALADGRSG